MIYVTYIVWSLVRCLGNDIGATTWTETDHYLPIHREAPAFVDQATEQQILVTGIKVLL